MGRLRCSSGRFVVFCALWLVIRFPKDLLVLLGLRCREGRPRVVGSRCVVSLRSDRFRRGVEQTGRFGRLGFRRS